MRIFKKSLFLLFLWIAGTGFSQASYRISGQVIDSETFKPLAFSQIALINSTIGTTSNEEGNFTLNIPFHNGSDSLEVFYLGYAPVKKYISVAIHQPIIIEMKPEPIHLSEVEVIGLTPEEVIRRAVSRIPDNYGNDTILLTAFVRVQKTLNNKLAEFAEAVINDLKNGYYLNPRSGVNEKMKRSNIPLLIRGRVVSDTNIVNALADIGKNASCLSCYFKEDIAEFYQRTVLDEKEFRFYNFRMEELTNPAGGKFYHILFDQKKGIREMLWKGEIYIESSDYAIMSVIMKPSLNGFETYEKKKYMRFYDLLGIPGWIKEMPLGQTLVTYSRRDGKWSLNTIRNDYWMTFTNQQSGKKIRYSYKSDVVVTDITRDTSRIRSYSGDKTIGAGQRWDQIAGHPDAEFWMNYNYLPVEKALRESIESHNQ